MDGVIGPMTVNAVNGLNDEQTNRLYVLYQSELMAHYEHSEYAKGLKKRIYK
jgi:lysozyme family protein